MLTISVEQREGWNTCNPRFWDFEGSHPNIASKDLREGPGGCPARTAFHYLWKDVGENGEEDDGVSSAYQTWSGGSTARPVGERIEAGQAKPTALCPPPERIESWLAQAASCPTGESTSKPAAKPGRLCPPARTTTTASTPGRYPDPPKSHPFSLDRPDMTHVVTPALPMQFQSPNRRHIARIRVPPHNNADVHGARYFPPVFNIENPCMVESESKRQESERKMNTYPGEITPHPQRRVHKSKAQQDAEDIAYLRKLIDDKKRLNCLREALPKLRASKTDLLVEVLGELQCSTHSPEYEPSKWCTSHSNTRTRAEGRDKPEELDASWHEAEGRVNPEKLKKQPRPSPGVVLDNPRLPRSPAEVSNIPTVALPISTLAFERSLPATTRR
ncbi:hypothetical protein FRC08_011994, partial [Ceratobasidium sp. 394]